MKEYFLKLLESFSDEEFAQQALEHHLITCNPTLTYNITTDARTYMHQYDEICAAFHKHCREQEQIALELLFGPAGKAA